MVGVLIYYSDFNGLKFEGTYEKYTQLDLNKKLGGIYYVWKIISIILLFVNI